ncbi:MAG: 30S ribosomal protein THX [Bacteroidales bacterium]|nr:30S ribosomal protein THX [Bacteroidales bacterium]
MGKGDKKTKRGKIILGSYGVRRPRKKKKEFVLVDKPKEKETEVLEKAALPIETKATIEEKAKSKPAKKKDATKKTVTKAKASAKKTTTKKAEPKEKTAPKKITAKKTSTKKTTTKKEPTKKTE